MKLLTIILLAIVLSSGISGCSALGGTVAGGQNGSVDYCVDLGFMEAICVKANRSSEPKKDEV